MSALALVESTREALIDEYGELDRRKQEFEPTARRHGELKKLIKGWYVDSPPSAEFIAEGNLCRIQVSACSLESAVNVRKAYKLLTPRKFLKICSITIKALEEALGAAVTATLVTKEPTGARRLKVVVKALPQQHAAA